jgi:glycosyltransferase involved in cell wall biosynthesis
VVRACERLHRKGLDIKLLLFDTPLDENGRAAAKAFSAKVPFEFILDYPVARTNELFNRADIFASAEKNAGWANTCAEAMACGLAVAATTSGAEDFLVNGKTGLVVHRNSWSLERAIATLAKDPELRARLGTNARRAIEAFDWENLAERILARVRERLA